MESRALSRLCHHPMLSCHAQHLASPHTVQGPMGHAARRPTCDSAWPQPLWPPVVKVRNHSLRYRNGRRHHGGYLLALSVRITAFSASNLAGCAPRESWCGCMHWPAHSNARHVAAVGITSNDMIVQWLELNRACAQPPAPHVHIAPLEG